MIGRRKFLKLSTLSAASLAMPSLVRSAFAAGDVISIAAPLPLSGPFAAPGKFASMGAAMAIEDAGSVLGRKLSYLEINTEGRPATAVRKVQEAMEQDGVGLFAGGVLSAPALAMGKEINQRGGVFFTFAGADEITGSECNKGTFRWCTPTYGAIRQTVLPLIEQMPNARRWYTITPQYVFGEGLLSATKAVFAEKGVEHVGNSYHSLDEKEFSGHLTNAVAAEPDVLLLLNFGSQSNSTLRQAASFGLKNRMTIVIAWAEGLQQFQELGSDLIEGVYFGAQYWHQIDSPFNNEFVAGMKKRKEENRTYTYAGLTASSYMMTKLLIDAADKAGSTEGPAVRAALEGMVFEGLTGSEEIRAGDHQVIKNYYLLKAKPKSAMKDEYDYADIVSFGRSYLSPEDAKCKMG
jgi:branched-chain amino acid transport system substrate-binding protein